MRILRHCDIEKDIKLLRKKFNTPLESLEAWEKLFFVKGLTQTPAIDQCGGYGNHKIYKARVIPTSENVGKSHGYRVVFKIEGDQCIIIVFSRHGIYKSEQELITIVKYRLNNLTTS